MDAETPRALGAIFDMDGTLIDSEAVIMREWMRVANEEGIRLTVTDYSRVIGLNEQASNQLLAAFVGGASTFERMHSVVQKRLSSQVGPPVFPLKAGARAVLERLEEQGIPCAIASSAKRSEIEQRLDSVDIRKYFRSIAAGDEVPRGKPDPAVYLLAASRLGLQPSHCLAFEDSLHGVASATAAGMKVVLIPDLLAPPALETSTGLTVLESLVFAVPRLRWWFWQA